MASVAHLLLDIENIVHEIEVRSKRSEANALKYFTYTRAIQRHVRGYITRQHINLLHKSAIIIQKNWRRYKARLIYRKILKEKFFEMCLLHYNTNASIIQKWWKGYWIRSRVFSYYRLKNWLHFVSQQNKHYKCTVEEHQSKNNAEEMKQREDEAKEWIVYILFKLHHLLRTHQISGIYSLPNTTELSEIEKMLTCLHFKDFMVFYNSYMEDLRQNKTKELPPFFFKHCKYIGHFEKEYFEAKKACGKFLHNGLSYYEIKQQQDIELSSKFKCAELPCLTQMQPFIVKIEKYKTCPCPNHDDH